MQNEYENIFCPFVHTGYLHFYELCIIDKFPSFYFRFFSSTFFFDRGIRNNYCLGYFAASFFRFFYLSVTSCSDVVLRYVFLNLGVNIK